MLRPELLHAPKRTLGRADSVVAGRRYNTFTPGLGTRLVLPWAA